MEHSTTANGREWSVTQSTLHNLLSQKEVDVHKVSVHIHKDVAKKARDGLLILREQLQTRSVDDNTNVLLETILNSLDTEQSKMGCSAIWTTTLANLAELNDSVLTVQTGKTLFPSMWEDRECSKISSNASKQSFKSPLQKLYKSQQGTKPLYVRERQHLNPSLVPRVRLTQRVIPGQYRQRKVECCKLHITLYDKTKKDKNTRVSYSFRHYIDMMLRAGEEGPQPKRITHLQEWLDHLIQHKHHSQIKLTEKSTVDLDLSYIDDLNQEVLDTWVNYMIAKEHKIPYQQHEMLLPSQYNQFLELCQTIGLCSMKSLNESGVDPIKAYT